MPLNAAVPADATSASQQIDARIASLDDWRGKTLATLRRIIKQADPQVVETVKWRGVPVWEHDGILCTGETYKTAVKMTFAKGAALDDPTGLFNASLEGNTRRAIDVHEGEPIDTAALKALIRAAVAMNVAAKAAKAAQAAKAAKAGRAGVPSGANKAAAKKTTAATRTPAANNAPAARTVAATRASRSSVR
jgi:hypothetical protein